MNVQEFYEFAKNQGLLDDDIFHVVKLVDYISLSSKHDKRIYCVCAFCVHRDTEKCPWPNDSSLTDQACLSFQRRQLVSWNINYNKI